MIDLLLEWMPFLFIIPGPMWVIISLLTSDHLLFFVKMTGTYFLSIKRRRKDKILEKQSTGPQISILIPAHNDSLSIKEVLNAALKNKYENKEIIVIEDGSKDDTLEIVKQFSDKGLVKLVERKHASGSRDSALIQGSAYATGEIYCVIDADVTLEQNALENSVKYFDDKEVQAISGKMMIKGNDEGNTTILVNLQKYEYQRKYSIEQGFSLEINDYAVQGHAIQFVRKEIFHKLNGFDEKLSEVQELDFAARIRKAEGKVIAAPDVLMETCSPSTIQSLMRQRNRWNYGKLEVFRKEKEFRPILFHTLNQVKEIFDVFLTVIFLPTQFFSLLLELVHLQFFSCPTDFALLEAFYTSEFFVTIMIYLGFEYANFFGTVMYSKNYKMLKLFYLVPIYGIFYEFVLKISSYKSQIGFIFQKRRSW